MSVNRVTYVNCDGCGECLRPDSTPGYTAVDQRAEARAEGDMWHTLPGGRDICPHCWDEGVR